MNGYGLLWGLITGVALLAGVLLLIILLVGWWPVLLLLAAGGFLGLVIARTKDARDQRLAMEARMAARSEKRREEEA